MIRLDCENRDSTLNSVPDNSGDNSGDIMPINGIDLPEISIMSPDSAIPIHSFLTRSYPINKSDLISAISTKEKWKPYNAQNQVL